MAVSARVTSTDKDLTVFVNEALSPDARRAALAAFAREALAEGQAQNRQALGRTPPHQTTVDNRRDAPLESVNPDGGVITFEFQIFDEALLAIGEMLRTLSPVRSGAYRNAHRLYADGVEVPLGGPFPGADAFIFTNSQPYARKIERGHIRLSVPGSLGVYASTAAAATARFSNIAKVKFSYEAAPEGAIQPYAAVAFGGRSGGKAASAAKRAANVRHNSGRFPALIVSMR